MLDLKTLKLDLEIFAEDIRAGYHDVLVSFFDSSEEVKTEPKQIRYRNCNVYGPYSYGFSLRFEVRQINPWDVTPTVLTKFEEADFDYKVVRTDFVGFLTFTAKVITRFFTVFLPYIWSKNER